jgi:hypothetical protein
LIKKREWKQVVEIKQISCTLHAADLPEDWKNTSTYINQHWINHPAVQMWNGYEESLKYYFNIFLHVAKTKHKINTTMEPLQSNANNIVPPW